MSSRRGLKRIIRRSLEELRATGKIASQTSVAGAVNSFIAKIDIQRMNRNGYQEPPTVRKRLIKKHETMRAYFEKVFHDFALQYDYRRPVPEGNPELGNRIWFCWWQGIEQAPPLVKACYDSICRHAGGFTVTLVTEENYRNYVHIPGWLEEKYQSGLISRTHYSDVLRLSLLAEHGGVWLDATFFCSGKDVSSLFRLPVWTIRRADYQHVSVASGRFATYSLGCDYEHRWVFATIRDFLLHYWKTTDLLIDYLVFDYLIDFVLHKDQIMAQVFASIEPNNPACDELAKVLEEPFDPVLWETIREDTSLFKLTWKKEFALQKDGQETFCSKLLEGAL